MDRKSRRSNERFVVIGAVIALAAFVLPVSIARNSVAAIDGKPSSEVDHQVNSIIARLTLSEKLELIGGVDGFFIRALPDAGLPSLRMADGPMGVRNFGPSTAMAAGINLAATWDAPLARRVGEQIGRDARAKGVNFLLGPGVNIYRAPMNGRNFEYFGEDPYLASRMAVGYIEGVQGEGVSATIKHFMGNNSEYSRHATNDLIDERTMREIYLPTFEAAVKEANVGAVMDSYNLVNGQHMTQNSALNTEILKNEWRFSGVLMSDWFSTYDGVAAANSGLDLEMPAGAFMDPHTIGSAIDHGKVSVTTIDDKVRRILRLAIESHWMDRSQTDSSIPRYNLEGDHVALEAAREGIVLLKNEGGTLPLDKQKIKSIAVIGPDAYPAVPVGGGSAAVRPFTAVSFLQGIAREFGSPVTTLYDPGIPRLSEAAQRTNLLTSEGGSSGVAADYFKNENLAGEPFEHRIESSINFGPDPNADLGVRPLEFPADTSSARWTGFYAVPVAGNYDCFVQSTGEAGGYYRVFVDGKMILDNWNEARALVGFDTMHLSAGSHKVVVEHHGKPGFLGSRFRFGIVRHGAYVRPEAEKLAASADAVVVAVGFSPESESEGADRTFRLPPGQDELINRMAALNKNTIVVVTSGGSVDMQDWIERVPAVLEAWYSGQEGGTALAEILAGDVNPSGRLPVTFERRFEDNPVYGSYYPKPDTEEVAYSEGVFVGYRGYEHSGTKPLFPFGYGLSYTTFRYGNISVRPIAAASAKDAPPKSRLTYEVSFDVTNTGHREGADVAEIYVGEANPPVRRPAKELKGFARVKLPAGATRRVGVTLDSRAFSYYDARAHEWRVDPGTFTISVGHSVDQIALTSTLPLTTSQVTSAPHPRPALAQESFEQSPVNAKIQ
ncbi:MAG TPA: glycoside hydrolase family 3 C-terminal domain-containing protein [Candidatus Acidoferrales bacterium]|nr:glycoside hydrolase family 3 C-terminal domain-containing protein [Candidatus Acidoferrales bacterium]